MPSSRTSVSRARRPRVHVARVASVALLLGILTTPAARAETLPTDCFGSGRNVITTPKGTITDKYSPDPPSDSTYDARNTTWRPSLDVYPIGVDTSSSRICWYDGAVWGEIPSGMTWEDAHKYNQPCIRIVAKGWMKVDGIRCDNTGDGFRPRETSTGADNVVMRVSDTYFTRIHDDCLENDGVIGGMLQDSLWAGCNTGVSEQPDSSFSQPSGETLTLDHMLIGLWITPHVGGAGENSLFKWSSSANNLVVKCSIFKVDALSLNHAKAMGIPGRIDDSACPGSPTTVVWLGGGPYPGDLPAGVRVTSDINVWIAAVSDWKCAHGYPSKLGC